MLNIYWVHNFLYKNRKLCLLLKYRCIQANPIFDFSISEILFEFQIFSDAHKFSSKHKSKTCKYKFANDENWRIHICRSEFQYQKEN